MNHHESLFTCHRKLCRSHRHILANPGSNMSKPDRLKSQWRCTPAFFALPHLLGIPAGIVEPPHMKGNTKFDGDFPQEFPLKHGHSQGYVNHAMAQPRRLHANAARSHALQPSSARRQRSQPHEPCGMAVSKNRGTHPKWMVKIMENPIFHG